MLWTPTLMAMTASCAPTWQAASQPSPDGSRTAVTVTFGASQLRKVFPWPVWVLQQADVDGDGCPDLLVGALKRNRFDSAARRRLQVWSVAERGLHPRWLGTRLGGELDTFGVDPSGRIVARERVGSRWSVARWRWRGFGFQSDSTLVAGAPSRPSLHSPSRKDLP